MQYLLIALNSGNEELDHQVNQFFKCIKKTGHTGGTNGEPSRGEVDTCYDTVFVSGDSSSSNFGTEVDTIIAIAVTQVVKIIAIAVTQVVKVKVKVIDIPHIQIFSFHRVVIWSWLATFDFLDSCQ